MDDSLCVVLTFTPLDFTALYVEQDEIEQRDPCAEESVAQCLNTDSGVSLTKWVDYDTGHRIPPHPDVLWIPMKTVPRFEVGAIAVAALEPRIGEEV